MNNKRYVYLDVLRILATIGVITIHTACQILDGKGIIERMPGSYHWNAAVIYDAYACCSVPLFVMISGSLFLGRDITIRKIYVKYIKRILLAYVTWGMLYAILYGNYSIKGLLHGGIYGISRFAFLGTIVALYMITPMLNQIIKDESVTNYMILLCLFFSFLVPQVLNVLNNSEVDGLITIGNIMDFLNNRLNLQFVMGMTGYYLLGYCLDHRIYLSKKLALIGFFGFLISGGVTAVITIMMTNLRGKAYYDCLHYTTINILIESIGLFAFIKYFVIKHNFFQKFDRFIINVSNATFGIYLVHTYILNRFLVKYFGIDATISNAVISVPAVTLLTFTICFFVVWVLRITRIFFK